MNCARKYIESIIVAHSSSCRDYYMAAVHESHDCKD